MFLLRPFQAKALAELARNQHVICVAPTGSGKSLCFELYCQFQSVRTILLSPLVALNRQHYTRLSSYPNLSVHLIEGGDSFPNISTQNESPPSKVLILSPEKLLSSGFQSHIESYRPNFLVMDEAHTIFEWGKTFRPSLATVPSLISSLQIETSLWLSATLTQKHRKNLSAQLPDATTEIGEFRLPKSLNLQILHMSYSKRFAFLMLWLKQKSPYGLIFVPTRKLTEQIARLLEAAGMDSIAYHAGLSREERAGIEFQISFHKKRSVVVSTSAFGMGMNIKHLEWAVLIQAPPSLMFLAQSIGRIARNHQTGDALLLWDDLDFQEMKWMDQDNPAEQINERLDVRHFLSSPKCARSLLEAYFNLEGDVPSP